MQTLAIFVDVQNIYYTCRQAFGRSFNYRYFLKQFSSQYQLVSATAYAIAPKDDGQTKFQDALRHMGFEVKTKPYIQRSDGSAKGDWDVGITIDIMDTAEKVDNILLLSGDGDFDLLLRRVQQDNCYTQVLSVPELTAKSLLDHCQQHHCITKEFLL
ncbi:NYN domain-containing protein [Shewanella maritima]|uniref:LabA-like NYN domain-containing protein n=1 Tax=Shewanella maritima TaxID=2520507 RepID=UPI003734D4D9